MTTQTLKPPTCNPKIFTLSGKENKARLDALAAKHRAEGLAQPRLEDRPGQQRFFFHQTPGDRNGHAGRPAYVVYIGRETTQEPVIGWCTCASSTLCKHLARAYNISKEILTAELEQHLHFKPCTRRAALVPLVPAIEPAWAEGESQAALDRDYEDLFGCPRPKVPVV